MKKLIPLALLPFLTISCNLLVPIDNNNDNDSIPSDSIVADSLVCDVGDEIIYSDGLRPLYVIPFNSHQYIHPFSFEEMYADNEYDNTPQEGFSCEEMIANAKNYTFVTCSGPQVFSVKFNKVQKGNWSHGFLNGREDNPEINGIIYDVVDPIKDDHFSMMLIDEDFSNSHIPQYVKNNEWSNVRNDKPMPAELKKKLEKETGFTISRSHTCTTISDPALSREDGHFYVAQSAEKNNKMIGLLVLEWDGKIAYSIDEAYYNPEVEPNFSWHVDDEGVYYPRDIMAAYMTIDGEMQLYYMDMSPESTSFCVMTVEGKKLVSRELNSYYNYYE